LSPRWLTCHLFFALLPEFVSGERTSGRVPHFYIDVAGVDSAYVSPRPLAEHMRVLALPVVVAACKAELALVVLAANVCFAGIALLMGMHLCQRPCVFPSYHVVLEVGMDSVWKFSTQNRKKTETVPNCTNAKPELPVPVLEG
jgi:hypothetical protein